MRSQQETLCEHGEGSEQGWVGVVLTRKGKLKEIATVDSSLEQG